MVIFGHQVDLLLVLQIVAALIVIGVFSIFAALQQSELHHLSSLQTATLFLIVMENHPKLKTLEAVLSHRTPGDSRSLQTAQRLLHPNTRKLIEEKIDEFKEPTGLWSQTLGLTIEGRWSQALVLTIAGLLAPFAEITLIFGYLHNSPQELLRSTPARRSSVAAATVLGVLSAGYLAVAFSVATKTTTFAIVIAVVGAVGALCSVVYIALLIWEQSQWKYYWRRYLGEAALCALKCQDTDAFSRTMLAKTEVDAAPTLPLPAGIGFYAAVFSATQFGLAWLSQNVNWL
jgi:hypothetical protein